LVALQAYSTQESFTYSFALHGLVVLLAVLGLPAIFPEKIDPEPFVMSVEIVPIGELTNLRSSKRPIKQAKKPAPAKPKKETKKAQVIESKPLAEPVPEDGLKEAKPKEEAKKSEEDELAALLDKLKKESAELQEQAEEKPQEEASNNTRSDKQYDDTMPLSISEKDAIKSQFIQCWRVPIGARDAATLAARVAVSLNQDGSVQQAMLAADQLSRYQSDRAFRAAADAAIRAVWKCNPIQNMPIDKYNSWKEIELNFDPSEMLY
jgi:type IV secretory pathway VirB10-like protein